MFVRFQSLLGNSYETLDCSHQAGAELFKEDAYASVALLQQFVAEE